jgi:hypothetical protein
MPKPPAKPPKKTASRTPTSKAAQTNVQPLGDHLAALLNPALVKGFGESPQAGFDSGPVTGIDPKLAESLGLDPTGDLDFTEARPKRQRPARATLEVSGSTATAESLKSLLEAGDPNLRDEEAWVPHRPARPEKSEGGISFKIVSEYEPKGDQPAAIDSLCAAMEGGERFATLLGATGTGKTVFFTLYFTGIAGKEPGLLQTRTKSHIHFVQHASNSMTNCSCLSGNTASSNIHINVELSVVIGKVHRLHCNLLKCRTRKILLEGASIHANAAHFPFSRAKINSSNSCFSFSDMMNFFF